MPGSAEQVLALSGGVGGAKLALGLADVLAAGDLHVLVNTGDDFEHLGLHISPDIDTLLYTLAGLANQSQGWGIEGETFHTMQSLERLGGETWFKLGDKDMATHLWRTERLRQGANLLEVTAQLAGQLGVTAQVHPMTEHAVRTTVHCEAQDLAFQHYFVREACQPAVSGFSFAGIEQALPNPRVMSLLKADSFGAVIVCPSNPFVSIDPILCLPGLWQTLSESSAQVVLVSPIVGGMAIKGPAAKMMAELDMPVTALGVAQHYAAHYPGLIDCFVIDESDAKLGGEIGGLGMRVSIAPTVMKSRQHKRQLALHVLSLIRS